jgi:hypothetical protein
MNEDFAIEPTAFRDVRDLKYALEKFGFSQGRFLAAYPAKWLKLVYEHMDSFPDVERKRAIALLAKYKDDRIVRRGLEFAPHRPWCNNATDQVRQGLLTDAFVAVGQAETGLKTIDDMSEEILGDSRSVRIPAKAVEYQKVARRLIEMSAEIRLVDPYLKVMERKRWTVLLKFLSVAASCQCISIVVFARHKEYEKYKEYKKWDDHRAADTLRRQLKEYASAGVSIKIHLVNDDSSPHKMHARYLLSRKGGLQFDKGFEEVDTEQFVTVDALSDAMLDLLYQLYWDGGHQFEVVETISWPG